MRIATQLSNDEDTQINSHDAHLFPDSPRHNTEPPDSPRHNAQPPDSAIRNAQPPNSPRHYTQPPDSPIFPPGPIRCASSDNYR